MVQTKLTIAIVLAAAAIAPIVAQTVPRDGGKVGIVHHGRRHHVGHGRRPHGAKWRHHHRKATAPATSPVTSQSSTPETPVSAREFSDEINSARSNLFAAERSPAQATHKKHYGKKHLTHTMPSLPFARDYIPDAEDVIARSGMSPRIGHFAPSHRDVGKQASYELMKKLKHQLKQRSLDDLEIEARDFDDETELLTRRMWKVWTDFTDTLRNLKHPQKSYSGPHIAGITMSARSMEDFELEGRELDDEYLLD